MCQLKTQDAVIVVFGLGSAQPGLHFLDAGEQFRILQAGEPAGRGRHGTGGLQGELEVGGDVRDFDLAIADEGAIGRLAHEHLLQ